MNQSRLALAQEIAAKCSDLARLEPGDATGHELKESVLVYAKIRRFVDAAETRDLAKLEQDKVTDQTNGLRTAEWLAQQTHIPRGAAVRRVNSAVELQNFPAFSAALIEGRIGIAHIDVVAQVANENNREYLNEVSNALIDFDVYANTLEPWTKQVENFARLGDPTSGLDAETLLLRNKLQLAVNYRGGLTLHGELTDHNAVLVRDLVNKETSRIYKQYVRDQKNNPDLKIPPHETLRALALVNLIRRGAGVSEDKKRGRQVEADITLVIKASEPLTGLDANGIKLADDTTRALLCSGAFTPIIVNNLGATLDAGDTKRYATRTQRRALANRDGGCAFPGCNALPSWCEAHHVIEWLSKGLTNLNNLALLCPFHHHVTHRNGWEMYAHTDESGTWFTWQTPEGKTIYSQRHQVRHRPPEASPEPQEKYAYRIERTNPRKPHPELNVSQHSPPKLELAT